MPTMFFLLLTIIFGCISSATSGTVQDVTMLLGCLSFFIMLGSTRGSYMRSYGF